MSEMKPCLFGNERCLCKDCKSNAAYPSCAKGFCINCFECEQKNESVHDVYLCTGYERRTE